MASLKRGSDEDSEGTVSKMSRKDDYGADDDGPRSKTGRIRKKSAKVLEMEEFEEAEKKQFTKKSDTKGKTSTPSVTSGPSVKKSKVKFVAEDSGAPVSAAITAVHSEALGQSLLQSPSIVQDSVSFTPVKTGTKQAVATKVKDGQGSVIKLLLSSPAIPTAPSVTTNVVTKTSPPMTMNAASDGSTSHVMFGKKGVSKLKTEPLIKEEPGLLAHAEENSFLKLEPMDTSQAHLLDAGLPQEVVISSQTIVKSEPVPAKDSSGSLKMKLMMSPKDSKNFESIFPTSVPIPNVFGGHDETDGETDATGTNSTTKTKSGLKKKKSSTSGEKILKQSSKLQSAAEQMPNLAALVTGSKNKKGSMEHKEDLRVSVSDGVDTSMSDASLDMSSIVDSALDMEEEAALVIAEGVAPRKPKKKRGTGKKKVKATSGEFDSDEGSSAPPEGDIAALAAKVRGTGISGAKKKSKKHPDFSESAALLLDSKKKRPPRRAPTAYMLYCNAQRPKVVSESPGIDFAQISRTLGVMWQCLSKKEKMMWRRKSKKLAGKGSTLISTGKGVKREISATSAAPPSSTGHQPPTAKTSLSGKAVKSGSTSSAALTMDDAPLSPVKGFGIEPIDIAAHLKLLGESLSIIGMRLQEHKGLIAVQGSLSVLLDSLLCACGPLMALTQQVPGLDGCSESTHARTLDSVAYIMPGL